MPEEAACNCSGTRLPPAFRMVQFLQTLAAMAIAMMMALSGDRIADADGTGTCHTHGQKSSCATECISHAEMECEVGTATWDPRGAESGHRTFFNAPVQAKNGSGALESFLGQAAELSKDSTETCPCQSWHCGKSGGHSHLILSFDSLVPLASGVPFPIWRAEWLGGCPVAPAIFPAPDSCLWARPPAWADGNRRTRSLPPFLACGPMLI